MKHNNGNPSFERTTTTSSKVAHHFETTKHRTTEETSEGMKILMKHSAPYVTYTQFHEKIINALVLLFVKHGPFMSLIFRLTFIASVIVPLLVLLWIGDAHAVIYIWFPCACVAILVVFVLVPYMILRRSKWDTIDNVNNDFYEPAIRMTAAPDSFTTNATHTIGGSHINTSSSGGCPYQPTPIEEIYYSNGVWRSAKTHNVLRFRGVNLPAKTPTYGHAPDIFYDAKKNVSFIDTPIPLNEAREHFQRISLYGFNILRLVVTWEAVMHEGPGIIDKEYLHYVSQLVDVAAEFGLYVIIDPHQDAWSRFTGGDGAPWWTLDVVGFVTDDDRLHRSGAAFVDHLQDYVNDPPAKMIWTTNYGKVATATMFTLFFAGDDYAPGIYVDDDDKYTKFLEGKNVTMQQFLQKYFLEYFDVVARTVKDKKNVIGFNSMNEPSNGYVGIGDLRKRSYPIPFGVSMNYFDGMKVGSGESIEAQFFSAPFYYHSRKIINPDGLCAWKTPEHDIWQKIGVYEPNPDTGEIQLNRPHHFSLKGKDFIEKYMVPLFDKIQQTITKHNKKFIVYAEAFIDVNNHQCPNAPQSLDCNKFAWAPHWYDGSILMIRRYLEWFALDDEKELPVVTKGWIDSTFKRILKHVKETGNGKLHTLLGEVGVPFDMDPSNQFEASTRALDRTMRAIEANNLDFTLWNYFPFNTIKKGDCWCGEDLSVRMVDRNRALLALIRPFVFKISSDFEIVRQRFDPSKKKKKYQLIVKKRQIEGSGGNNEISIYLPHFHFDNPLVYTTFGSCSTIDTSFQLLIWDCSAIRAEDLKREVVLTIENSVH